MSEERRDGSEGPVPTSSGVPASTRRALVVEDEEAWQEYILHRLQARGLVVDIASNLDSASTLLSDNEYDVALLDVRLEHADSSDSTGLRIARLVRERNPEALIVLLTGYPAVALIKQAFSAGVDDFLDKSQFSTDALNSLLDTITVRRETELESIRQSQLNKLIYEILSMMSHELRTPLISIQRSAEALSLGALGPLSVEQAEAVESIRHAVQRELVLLNAHLDLNRIERGANRLDSKECDLVALVRKEIAAHEVEANRKGIRLRINLPKEQAIVRIDVNRFRVALNPLMDNAIKFSQAGSEIYISASLTSNYVEVGISDLGPGIGPNEIERLMNLQTEGATTFTQRIRSSGLGLIMAKRMIELQGGTLWIESDGNHGTTVSFRLPISE